MLRKSIIIMIGAIVLIAGGFPCNAHAQEQPPISDIEVQGLVRIDLGAVFDRISQRPGLPISPEGVTSDIKSIYGMGYFSDVRVDVVVQEGGLKLVYVLKEKPSVRRVDFFGNEEVSDEKIEKALTLSPGSMADRVLIEENANAIRLELAGEGFPKASVVPVLREVSDKHLLLTYLIDEGPEVSIDTITFEGNEEYSDRKLRGIMKTGEWGIFSWLTGSGTLERDELMGDIQLLQDYYHNNGYVKAVIHDPVVQYEDNLEWLDISIKVEEGVKYSIANIAFSGCTIFKDEELLDEIKSRPGDVVDRSRLSNDVTTLTDMITAKGYALATVYPDVQVNDNARLVKITFRISEGDIYRVGRIEIRGNYKTRDKVIRREIKLKEGELFDGSRLRKSYRGLSNLNFFSDIKMDPRPDASTKVLDLNVEIAEKLTGSFNVGGGYSSVDKFVGMVDLVFGNLGGRGQYLKLKSQFSSTSTRYELEFRDPWIFDRPLSFSFSLFKASRDYTDYSTKSKGFSLGLGKRFWEDWSVGGRYRYSITEIFDVSSSASRVLLSQQGETLTSSISPYISYDSRDNYMMPHEGMKHTLSATYAGLGGDNKFFKWTVDSRFVLPVSRRTELSLRGRYGYAIGIDGHPLPLYERFYVGSVFTVRGLRRLGPKDRNGNYIGGGQKVIFNADYTFPATTEGTLKWVMFYDAGTAFDKEINLRYTAGAGFNWFSPIGPMSLVWAKNLYPEKGEATYRWEFAIGAMF